MGLVCHDRALHEAYRLETQINEEGNIQCFHQSRFLKSPKLATPSQLGLSNSVESERHFTAKEVAEAWNLSQDTIYRLFVNEPGVLILASERKKYRRTRRTLRIPESVKNRVYRRLQNVAR